MRDTQILEAIKTFGEKQEKIHDTVVKTQIDVARMDSNLAGLQLSRVDCMSKFKSIDDTHKDVYNKIEKSGSNILSLIGGIAGIIISIIAIVIATKGVRADEKHNIDYDNMPVSDELHADPNQH